MKRSVADLLQLVGGRSEESSPASASRHGVPMQAQPPVAQTTISFSRHGSRNGHSQAVPEPVTTARGRKEVPLEGDLKDL